MLIEVLFPMKKFGLAMVVDVLRGSKSAKIVERHFDRLATHGTDKLFMCAINVSLTWASTGKGKNYSKEWWSGLSRQLLHEGYITENISNLYKTYSLSPKGLKWSKTITLHALP